MVSEKTAFRIVVALAGLVPVGAGLAGALGGAAVFAAAPDPFDLSLDSHARYLSGLLLGIGLAFWATLGRPEVHGARYRLLGAVVVLGGLARAFGLLAGEPDLAMRLALVMELVVTPAICLWQARLARNAP
ncbi:DUF4345 domain-containing protein [Chenggangzhangella methanolivorans]|uniref:DUF4345 domain-containing protein n=1 Tax=Chenggangzhangella methanolivorans TaxID=1437009 RepID=A0A9E6R9R1_9HYPH|nr:DUF4345 domain-containing protein [Chenggangzhangella methanolivorans]QZO00803.1 DUF4345 domain-containing protein [Chenggangzhangella methanolivorans]